MSVHYAMCLCKAKDHKSERRWACQAKRGGQRKPDGVLGRLRAFEFLCRLRKGQVGGVWSGYAYHKTEVLLELYARDAATFLEQTSDVAFARISEQG